MRKKQLRSRIRAVLEEMPDGGTADEISEVISTTYNTQRSPCKEVSGICAHDAQITSNGKLSGINMYILKKHLN